MTFKICLLDESNDMEAYARAENIRWAWHQWVIESCVERNRGHRWELEFEHPDDGAGIQLGCAHCPAGADDLFPDGHDLISVDLPGVTVRDGHHDADRPMIVAVEAEVWTNCYSSPDGDEYDAGIELTPVGPLRVIEE